MVFLTLNVVFLIMSLYFLFLGLKVFLTKKPFLIAAKYNFFILFLAFASQLVMPISNVFRQNEYKHDNFDWFTNLSPLFLILVYSVLLFYLWKTMQGYLVIGINEDSFRNSLQSVLNELGLPFEERLSKMRLTSLDTDLQSSINAWSGVATLKVKDSKYKETEKEIAENLQKRFIEEDSPVNLRTSYFYIFMGSLMFVFFVGFTYWTWTNESLWRSY